MILSKHSLSFFLFVRSQKPPKDYAKKAKSTRRRSGIDSLPTAEELNVICQDPYGWLESVGIIKSQSEYRCPHCAKAGFTSKCSSAGKNSKQLKCNKSTCKKKSSRLDGTFFAGCKIGLDNAIRIIIYTVAGYEHKKIVQATGLSKDTVTHYMKFTRLLCIEMIDEEDTIIGGDGIVVEIDESKFAKRKYNRGHRVGTKEWVFGGIEKEVREGVEKRKYFALIVPNRSRATLEPIIRRHILEGSTVISDCWKAYDWMSEEGSGYTHLKVNHSETYKDPETGACTNTIEGKWNGMKQDIPDKFKGAHLEMHLLFKVWKDQNCGDMFNAIISALKEVEYTTTMEEAYEDPVEEEVVVHRSEEVVRAALQEAENKVASLREELSAIMTAKAPPQGGPSLSAAARPSVSFGAPPGPSLSAASARPSVSFGAPPQGGSSLSAASASAAVGFGAPPQGGVASLHTPHREIETNSTPSRSAIEGLILPTQSPSSASSAESCEQVMKVAVQSAQSPSLSDDASVYSFEEIVETGPKPILKVGDTIQYYAHAQVGVPHFLRASKVTRVNANPANPCVLLEDMDTITLVGCGDIKRIDPPDERWRSLESFDLIESQTENVRKEASTFSEILQRNMRSVVGGQFAPMDMLQDVARPASSTCGDDDSSDDEVSQMQSQVPQQKRLRRTRRNPTPKRDEDYVYEC